jgi:Na+/phosphate symporter
LLSESYINNDGMLFMDLIASLEKIGDHVINVDEAMAGKK